MIPKWHSLGNYLCLAHSTIARNRGIGDGIGLVDAGVRDDIDGDLRSWCYPDLGADTVPGGNGANASTCP